MRTLVSLFSHRQRHRLAATIGVAIGAGALVALALQPALAVHDTGVFQLDGNAQSSVPAGALGDDWDNVCHEAQPTICPSGTNTSGAGGATAVGFTNDGAKNATIFTGGGSKDPQDISSWQWKDQLGGLPDKDNLQDSFAARYSAPVTSQCPSTIATCELLYFGSDRLDNSGDAQEGFWFFQNPITLNKTNGTFNGVHKVGDLLILSDFSNGGGTSTINIYKWVGTGGDTNGTLDFVTGGATSKCGGSSPDAFCGIVNPTDGTPSPWPFTDKSGFHTFLNGEFYEGGVNLSDPSINLGSECFASVASETRSSTSPTATLKDFVLGNFGKCGSTTVTTPQQSDGTNIPAGGLSIGTGTVQVQDQAKITATGSGGVKPTGTVTFHLCGPLAAGALCDTGGTQIGSPITLPGLVNPTFVTSDLATVSSAGRYCFRADYSGDSVKGIPGSSDSSEGECFNVNPVTPALATSAGPSVVLGNPVTDTATLTGTANEPGTPVINPTTAGGPAQGTITFKLFGPSDTVCGPLVFTSNTVAVSGDGTYGPVQFTPTAVGTYHWVAVYSGDPPNTNGTDHNTGCNDTGEDVTVTSVASSMTTAQSFIPNDSATITAPTGGALAGSVHFQVFESTDCTGTAIHDQTVTVSGASPQTVSTTNTTHSTTSANVSWLVSYNSTNPAQRDIPATCLEKSALSIDNDGSVSSP